MLTVVFRHFWQFMKTANYCNQCVVANIYFDIYLWLKGHFLQLSFWTTTIAQDHLSYYDNSISWFQTFCICIKCAYNWLSDEKLFCLKLYSTYTKYSKVSLPFSTKWMVSLVINIFSNAIERFFKKQFTWYPFRSKFKMWYVD